MGAIGERPLYVDGPRRGDLVVVGWGGDEPDKALTKVVAMRMAQPTGVSVDEYDRAGQLWPKGEVRSPKEWAVGVVAVTRSGQVAAVDTRDEPDGRRLDLTESRYRNAYVRYVHQERFADPDVTLAFAAVAPSFDAAVDVLATHATGWSRAAGSGP